MSAIPRGIVGAEVVIAFTIIASFTLVFRLYTRYFLAKNPGREELAIILAWVSSRFCSVMRTTRSPPTLSPHISQAPPME